MSDAEFRAQVGKRLRTMRTEQGLGLRALARASRLNKDLVCRVEYGRSNITLLALYRWAAVLGCSVREFAARLRMLDRF